MQSEIFYKYQSLGNDFILLDWLNENQDEINNLLQKDDWADFVCHLCSRNFGVGADGVLIIRQQANNQIEGMVFNADGSNGGLSLNGLRCIAGYLMKQKKQSSPLTVFMGNKQLFCNLEDDKIRVEIGNIVYKNEQKLSIDNERFVGHVVDTGNPHFVVLSNVDPAWLGVNGVKISEHKFFPDRTNVEFIWEHPEFSTQHKAYCLFVYERGCGITLACGSGAAAAVSVLHKLGKIKTNESIIIEMAGGELITQVNSNNKVEQIAEVELVFKGSFT